MEPLTKGLKTAKQFFEQAKIEFASDDIMIQKHGCEKAYRAATEAVDALLAYKGYEISDGDHAAHTQRAVALVELRQIDERFSRIAFLYSNFKNILHGIAYYDTTSLPKTFKQEFFEVNTFIDLIEHFLSD